MKEIWVDADTKVSDKKRDGTRENPFKNLMEAFGKTMSKEDYEIRLLREI